MTIIRSILLKKDSYLAKIFSLAFPHIKNNELIVAPTSHFKEKFFEENVGLTSRKTLLDGIAVQRPFIVVEGNEAFLEKSFYFDKFFIYTARDNENREHLFLYGDGFPRFLGLFKVIKDNIHLIMPDGDFYNGKIFRQFQNKVVNENASKFTQINQYYSSSDKATLAVMTWHWHLGHHLWNELTALFHLYEKSPESLLVLITCNESEHYGPLPTLFANKNWTFIYKNTGSLSEYCFLNNILLIPVISKYIKSNLSQKLLHYAKSNEVFLRKKFEKETKNLNILVNIRTGNRYLVNQADFFIHLSNELVKLGFSHNLILDGTNINKGKDGQSVDTQDSINRETEIANKIESNVSKNVGVFNLLGASVTASICACNLSDFFIAPWGAGLAKYSWVAKKEGFVFSNTETLTNKHDLDIYHSSKYIENPSSIEFFPTNLIADMSSDNDDPFRANYEIFVEEAVLFVLSKRKLIKEN